MKLTYIEKIVLSIIGFCVLVLIISAPFTMKACSKLLDEIELKGLKGAAEEIWEGNQEMAAVFPQGISRWMRRLGG